MLYVAAGLLVIVALLAVLLVTSYNALVLLRNRVRNAFAQIDVQLKRRYDLIPNLVEAAKGYMAHERSTLEAVTRARAASLAAAGAVGGDPMRVDSMRQLIGAEGTLTGALGRLRLVGEAYPDLKANANVALLMEELGSTENRIAFARQAYNDAVLSYNTRRQLVPTNLIAGPMHFAPATSFELADDAERENVHVKLA